MNVCGVIGEEYCPNCAASAIHDGVSGRVDGVPCDSPLTLPSPPQTGREGNRWDIERRRPKLETIRHWTADELLVNILDPNREVSPNYFEYVVALDDGRVITGMIASETPSSITLRRAEGVQETILRANISEIATPGKSLMPEGLEKKISVQEMADVLAFLLMN